MQQAQNMRLERLGGGVGSGQAQADSGQPSGESGGSNPNQREEGAEPIEIGELPDLKSMNASDWAKLPPKVAEKLLESKRGGMSPEFADQITQYLRVLNARGRKKTTPSKPKK